jgi:WD40 repeat protein
VLAAGTAAGWVVLVDVGRRQVLPEAFSANSAVRSLAFSPGGGTVAAGTAAGKIHLLRAASLVRVRTLSTNSPVTALAFLAGEELLASGGSMVEFHETSSGRSVLTLGPAKGPVRMLRVNQEGNELVVADGQGVVRVLDLTALEEVLRKLRLRVARLGGSP